MLTFPLVPSFPPWLPADMIHDVGFSHPLQLNNIKNILEKYK